MLGPLLMEVRGPAVPPAPGAMAEMVGLREQRAQVALAAVGAAQVGVLPAQSEPMVETVTVFLGRVVLVVTTRLGPAVALVV